VKQWRAAVLLFVVGCTGPTGDLLAKQKWASAREAARWRSGESGVLVQTWMERQSTLTVLGSAREARAEWPDTEHATWPLAVRARFDFRAEHVRAMGFYKVRVRARGVLWTGSPHGARDWALSATVWRVFGDDAKRSAWAMPPQDPKKDALLDAYHSFSLVCSTQHEVNQPISDFPRPGDEHCETELLLIPSRFAAGPPALFLTALVQWPDDEADATSWRTLEFRVPLPERATLAESVSAALGDGTTPRTLAATRAELGDLE
jgi:hypothetical protein